MTSIDDKFTWEEIRRELRIFLEYCVYSLAEKTADFKMGLLTTRKYKRLLRTDGPDATSAKCFLEDYIDQPYLYQRLLAIQKKSNGKKP